MRKLLLAFLTGLILLFIGGGTPTEAAPASYETPWSNAMNQTSYWSPWQCTKYSNHSGYIPAEYDAAIIKDGSSVVKVYPDLTTTGAFTATGAINPSNGRPYGSPHSWVMKCKFPPPATTTTTTTLPPETTTTTTLPPETTTTTTSPPETTLPPETTAPPTTIPDTSVPPEITTTTTTVVVATDLPPVPPAPPHPIPELPPAPTPAPTQLPATGAEHWVMAFIALGLIGAGLALMFIRGATRKPTPTQGSRYGDRY